MRPLPQCAKQPALFVHEQREIWGKKPKIDFRGAAAADHRTPCRRELACVVYVLVVCPHMPRSVGENSNWKFLCS